jgi:hypothetical protein
MSSVIFCIGYKEKKCSAISGFGVLVLPTEANTLPFTYEEKAYNKPRTAV